ncbi:MAG: exopolyphosphatase [Gammaproteobacteria bacterium]|nr:MAG: exopolyphosphatase [Gammaproteobacteria bacterium]
MTTDSNHSPNGAADDNPDDIPDENPYENGSKVNSFAAIDLGSNSFHMLLAEPQGALIRGIDSLRHPVRLGAGLDDQGALTQETRERALDSLSQFAERLRGVPLSNVRMVGTNTLRRARNASDFLREARQLIGKPIEIISGREEARLIYLAIAHTQPDASRRRLVVDIGGGSTELIIGRGMEPELMESTEMGCVTFTNHYLGDAGRIGNSQMKKATIAAELELDPIARSYRHLGWDDVIGCSGTIKATSLMLGELGLSDGTITRDALRRLAKRIASAGSVESLGLESISSDRAQVVAGGIAVLRGVFNALEIESMQASTVALREGLIFDMIGRKEHVDLQQRTTQALASRFSIDQRQADLVEATATRLFHEVADTWQLDETIDLPLLQWAARLHEIGLGVSHSQYHRHGAYLLKHSDLLGFSQVEQNAIALLVGFHRRKLDKEEFTNLPDADAERLLRLLVLLRLAALLHRGRHDEASDGLSLKVRNNGLVIKLSHDWARTHPLTWAELSAEAERLTDIDIRLRMKQSG